MLKHTTLNESDQAGVKKLLKASNGFQLALTNTNIKEHPKHMFKKKNLHSRCSGSFQFKK